MKERKKPNWKCYERHLQIETKKTKHSEIRKPAVKDH